MRKISTTVPVTALALTVFTLATADSRAEESSATSASSSSPSVTRTVPMKNHWDATAWDHSGGILFWHAVSEKRRPTPPATSSGRNTRRASTSAGGYSGWRAQRAAKRTPAPSSR